MVVVLTADPHIETLVDAVHQVMGWADVRCPKEEYSAGVDAVRALAARLEAAERDLERFAGSLDDMVDWAERTRGGDKNLDPEEFHIRRDYARILLNKRAALAAAQQPPAEESDG